MDLTAFLALVLLCVAVQGSENITAWYGKTFKVPCNGSNLALDGLVFVKWKYVNVDKSPGDLLIKQAKYNQVTIQAAEDYASRISIGDDYSLHVSQTSLRDQKVFTCMAVYLDKLMEYPVYVFVNKTPSSVEIIDKSEALKKDIMTTVGTCTVKDSNPAATITWTKNKIPLKADEKGVSITPSVKLNPATGLSTSYSTLQYAATKEDAGAVFTCVSTYERDHNETQLEPLPVHYPSEKVRLEIEPKGPINEGANVTLRCAGDGNPPPNSFFFYKKGEKIRVENSNTLTLTRVSKEDTGLYKCSLPENEKLEASQNITVHYVNLDLSPSGRVVKKLGGNFSVQIDLKTSIHPQISWTKDGKLVSQPEFERLHYADAGLYTCKASIPGVTSSEKTIELVVEGMPVITSLSENTEEQVLTCEAVGVPEPQFRWNVKVFIITTSYTKGKAIQRVNVTETDLLVTCNVSNKFGGDMRSINVTSGMHKAQNGSPDYATIVMVVLILFVLVVAALGVGYWLFKRNRAGEFYPVDRNDTENAPIPETSNHTP